MLKHVQGPNKQTTEASHRPMHMWIFNLLKEDTAKGRGKEEKNLLFKKMC